MTDQALLVLADGSVFRGQAIGATGRRCGEVVFNTAMTGYQEILTDPSYARQLVTLTFPQIGNVGVNDIDAESDRVHAAGLVIRDASRIASNWRSEQTLQQWLIANDVVAIAGIDTRRLTRHLREHGSQAGCLVAGAGSDDVEAALAQARAFPGLAGMDLAREVTTAEPYRWQQGSYDLEQGRFATPSPQFTVVAYDFGVKRNILRLLADRGCDLHVVPAQTPAAQVLALKPDGVLLSNGPGDPSPCSYAISAIGELLAARVPLFGICLGHQLLALAAGARTVKMKSGHHGGNHPVIDLGNGRVMISSQNHGFAVDEGSLPDNVRASHRSLFDQSNQGLDVLDAPAFSFQGHPEASPGPADVGGLFDRFISLMREHRQAEASS